MHRLPPDRFVFQTKLYQRIEELEQENKLLRYEIQQIKDKWYKPKPPKKDKTSKPEPKKKGAPWGHFGWFRRKPPINKVEIVTLKHCPLCNSPNLTECKQKEEHIQEDITLPQVNTIKYIRYHYYCRNCKKVVSGKGKEELPSSYIGPIAKAIANFLRYGVKISLRDIQRIFRDLFNLTAVPSSIHGFNNQLRNKALPVYKEIKRKINRSRSFCHADETGWKLNGENHWLWSFSNRKTSFFHIDKSRGQKVVKEILGDKYNGVLISDFLSSYNKIKAKAKQRCIIHLKRDIDKVIACSEDESVKYYCQNLLELLKQAEQLAKDYKDKKLAKEQFERKRELLAGRLKDFNFPDITKRHLKRLSQRLMRHKNELFTFLYHPGVSSNNNHAERQIRHNVIFRKITFGNRSVQGVLNHGVLMSILQTAKLNKLDPLMVFRKILTFPDGKKFANLLMPP